MSDVPWYAYWPSNDDAVVFGPAGVAASSMPGSMVSLESLASDAVEAALAAKKRKL